MSIQPAAAKKPGLLRRMRHYRNIYLMLLPVIIFYILFHYVPMGGLAIAFENYKPAKGILGSDWVGLKNFRKFLTGIYAWRVIRNTLTLNLLLLLFGFPAPILLALMINEMRENWYKKTIQTVSYMPHFVALVVVCGLLREFCLTTGLINDIIAFFGGTRINLLSSLDHYRTVYVVSNIWQNIGWNSIIYLSALSSVDASLHEAAAIDGAGRIRRIIHVNLPAILPVIIIQLILRIGNLMTQGYEKTILLYSPIVYEKADLISTYVYRYGLEKTQYSYGSAVGVFNSVANLIFLITANKISARLSETSLW
ncbi:MAG: ABC transporter permease subunit [Clostridiales bacterium]|nr:sugar ABC transporter permease [Eubacteriales bacterium]MCI5766824.1 ABC transporter permease subunit [Clostridiales bacterium]